jgi:hypothetical protein
MAKMPKGECFCGSVQKLHYLLKKHCANVRDEINWGVEHDGHGQAKAAMKCAQLWFVEIKRTAAIIAKRAMHTFSRHARYAKQHMEPCQNRRHIDPICPQHIIL